MVEYEPGEEDGEHLMRISTKSKIFNLHHDSSCVQVSLELLTNRLSSQQIHGCAAHAKSPSSARLFAIL